MKWEKSNNDENYSKALTDYDSNGGNSSDEAEAEEDKEDDGDVQQVSKNQQVETIEKVGCSFHLLKCSRCRVGIRTDELLKMDQSTQTS